MSACARGCTQHNQHTPTCLCTPECPDHPNHCRGCQPRPTTTGHYCQKCADQFRDALHAIPELVTLVAQNPGGRLHHKQTPSDTSRRPTKVDQQSPSPAWDTADEVILWAAAWAWILSGRPGYDPIRYSNAGLPIRELTRAITHISNRLTQALTDDYHTAIWEETTTLHRQLIYATGTDRLEHRIKAPCPSCNQRSLIRMDGANQVECRNRDCARIWTEDQYATLAHVATS